MKNLEIKSLNAPDVTKYIDKGTIQFVNLNGTIISRATFQPGWKWSTHLKPQVKTASCTHKHVLYALSGTMKFKMNDGAEKECSAGEICYVSPGHDAWVVGDKPAVVVDFPSMADVPPNVGPQDQLDLLNSLLI